MDEPLPVTREVGFSILLVAFGRDHQNKAGSHLAWSKC